MQVTQIPFVRTVGIQRDAEGRLMLPGADELHNHLGTLHASAQFALAETASGDQLQRLFPELVGRVVPLLRGAEVKFRKPATGPVHALASVSDEARERFNTHLQRKGRASISVHVEVRDGDGAVTCAGSYDWYVQTL